MSRVPLRVHGPYLHRSQWRLDVFDNGARSKLSYVTYGEALRAAHAIATGAETRGPFAVSVEPIGNRAEEKAE